MARKPRINLPGVAQHVIQRGNNREPCFFVEGDYRYYLDSLFDAAERYDCSIHAYVLMTNHVHLLVTPNANWALSQLMQSLGVRYMRYITVYINEPVRCGRVDTSRVLWTRNNIC